MSYKDWDDNFEETESEATYDPKNFGDSHDREPIEEVLQPIGKIHFQRWNELCAIADSQQEDWFIEGWLEFGCLGLFTGLPFSGKSTMIGQLIADVSHNRPYYGKKIAQCPIILFDFENKERIFVKRVRSCLKDEPGKIQDLLFRVPPKIVPLPLTTEWVAEAINQLRAMIGAVGKRGFLLVDTFRSAFSSAKGYDEVDPGAMVTVLKPFKNLAEETGWAIMVLHHNAKHSNTYSGSTAIASVADYMWNWKSNKDTLKAELSFETRDEPQPALSFSYNMETKRNELEGTVKETKQEEKTSQKDVVKHGLLKMFPHEEPGITVDDFAVNAGIKPRWAASRIADLYAEGLITRVGTGRSGSPFHYFLTDNGQDFVFLVGCKLGA